MKGLATRANLVRFAVEYLKRCEKAGSEIPNGGIIGYGVHGHPLVHLIQSVVSKKAIDSYKIDRKTTISCGCLYKWYCLFRIIWNFDLKNSLVRSDGNAFCGCIYASILQEALNPHDPQAQPGALNKGQRASTGLTTCECFEVPFSFSSLSKVLKLNLCKKSISSGTIAPLWWVHGLQIPTWAATRPFAAASSLPSLDTWSSYLQLHHRSSNIHLALWVLGCCSAWTS